MPPVTRQRGRSVALFCLLFVVYNANLRQASSGDTLMARYVPIVVLRWGTLDLDRLVQIDPAKGGTRGSVLAVREPVWDGE